MKAAFSGDARMVKSLLKHKANVNATSKTGDTALMVASRYGTHVPIIKILIKAGADIDYIRPEYGSTALIRAVGSHEYYAVKALLLAGANPNIQGDAGETALHCAVKGGGDGRFIATVEILLEYGADCLIEDKYGRSSYDRAIREIQTLFTTRTDYLRRKQEKDDLAAAKYRKKEEERRGAEAESKRQEEGLTPEQFELMLAVENKDVEVIKALLAAKVDEEEKRAAVNIRTAIHGETPLMRCAKRGTVDVAKELIKAGAQIDDLDPFKKSVLMFAASYDNTEVVKLLLQKGAHVGSYDNGGKTALMSANNNAEITQLLVNAYAGIDYAHIDHQDKHGATALMLSENKDVTRVLIEGKADVDIKDNDGHTYLSEKYS